MNRFRYWLLLLALGLILLLAFGLTVHVDTFTREARLTYSQPPRVTWGEGWFQHWRAGLDAEQREHELRVACLSGGKTWDARRGCVTPTPNPNAIYIPRSFLDRE